MHRIFTVFLVSLLMASASVYAQVTPIQPRVLFAVERFYHPEEGPYVEMYLSFDDNSLMHKQVDGGKYQAKLEVLYVIKKHDKVVKYDKFEVLGPLLDGANLRQDFKDVQSYTLPKGDYTIDITITDVNQNSSPVKAKQSLNISLDKREVGISDFLWASEIKTATTVNPFTKSGMDVSPWLVPTLPKFMNEIYLYAEVYNTDFALGSKSAYIEKHALTNIDIDSIFPAYSFVKRVSSKPVNVLVKKVNVKDLPQGNYLYTVELYDRENKLVGSQSSTFYRESEVPTLKAQMADNSFVKFEKEINSQTDRDSIVDYFRCVRPLGERSDQNFIDNNWKNSSSAVLKAYLITFWEKRDTLDPYTSWMGYRQTVRQVEKEYGNAAQRGYDTDRGMTYLRYGPPNQIVTRENEPSSYPYIIWQYYAHPKQNNAMYVFYDPSLTYRDYVLLHSNVRGEKNNERWKLILQSRNNPNADIDQESGIDHWGGEVDDYYTNPR